MSSAVGGHRTCDSGPVTAVSGDRAATQSEVANAGVPEAFLDAARHVAPSEIADAVARLGRQIGAHDVTVYLVDHSQMVLSPLPDSAGAIGESIEIDTTIAGRAYQTETVTYGTHDEGQAVVWVPLMDGAARIGVLRADTIDDSLTRRRLETLATLVASIVVSRARYGDPIEQVRRRQHMILAAEMRWSTLPPLTYRGPGSVIAGVLEPAYEIGGDTFDYGINGDITHFAILDAMGHGLQASMIASLAVSSYRHSRRSGLQLQDMIRAMDAAVGTQFSQECFVTAQLGTLDAATGELKYVSAGHPAPMLVRNGRMLGDLPTSQAPPPGLGFAPPEVMSTDLEPGDRILFFSDGTIEARSPEGELFGRARLGDLLERAVASGLPPSEVVRRLMRAMLDHQQDVLQDDATLLMLEWPDGAGHHRARR